MLILDPSIHGVVVAGEGGKVGVHKPEDKAMESVMGGGNRRIIIMYHHRW